MSDSPTPAVPAFAEVPLNDELVIRLTPVFHGRIGRYNKVDLRLYRLARPGGVPEFYSTSAGFHIPLNKIDEFVARLRAMVPQSQR